MKSDRKAKEVSAFRLTAEARALLKKAAREAKRSEADIVEECIFAQVDHVVDNFVRRRLVLSSKEAVAKLAPVSRGGKKGPGKGK